MNKNNSNPKVKYNIPLKGDILYLKKRKPSKIKKGF